MLSFHSCMFSYFLRYFHHYFSSLSYHSHLPHHTFIPLLTCIYLHRSTINWSNDLRSFRCSFTYIDHNRVQIRYAIPVELLVAFASSLTLMASDLFYVNKKLNKLYKKWFITLSFCLFAYLHIFLSVYCMCFSLLI